MHLLRTSIWLQAFAVVLPVTATDLPASTSRVVVEVEGQLQSTSFRGYAYQAYEIEVAGQELLISVNAEFDSYLLLHRQDETSIFRNDNSGRLNQAFLEIEEDASGVWLAYVTTHRAGTTGPFTLRTETTGEIIRVDPAEPDSDVVSAAFAARKIYSEADLEERASQRKVQELKLLRDQLLVDSFRERLIERLSSYVTEERADSSGYDQLRDRERDLASAILESETLSSESGELIRQLLRKELEETRSLLDRAATRLEQSIRQHAAYSVALDELRRLDEQADELQRLEEQLLDPATGLGAEDLYRAAELRATVAAHAEELADRLVESAFVRAAAFEAMVIDRGLIRLAMNDLVQISEPISLGTLANHALLDGPNSEASELSRLARATGGNFFLESLPGREAQRNFDLWLEPLFPWPPPEASSRVVLSDRLVPGWPRGLRTLGDIDDLLNRALAAAGYSGPSYWGVGGGFALVTQLEQTNRNAVPLSDPHRWAIHIVEMKKFNIPGYLRALLTAPMGYYRVLTFVVSPEPFSAIRDPRRFETVERWAREGHDRLPPDVRSLAYSDDHEVTVLVYEFEKSRDRDDPRTKIPGRFTASQHLRRSAILAGLL